MTIRALARPLASAAAVCLVTVFTIGSVAAQAPSRNLPNIVSGPLPPPSTGPAVSSPTAPGGSGGTAVSGATVSGPRALVPGSEQLVTSTAIPSTLPLVFTDEAGLLEQGRTVTRQVRVQGKLGQTIGTAEEAERLRQVILRGSLQAEDVKDDTAAGGDGVSRRVKISWTSVSRPDTNRTAILPAPLQSQFRTNGNVVGQGQQVNAAGDYTQVLTAVNSLYGDGPPPAAGEAAAAAPPQTTVSNELENPTNAERGVGGGGAGAVDGSGNSKFATPNGFVLPEVVETAASELPPVVTESSENCPARVDLEGNVVVFQSQVLENGVPTSACQDTLDRFTLQKSYVGCADEVVQAASQAFATFRRYYMDKNGATQYVDAECVRDEQAAFDLVEDESACTISADLGAMRATVRSQLVYTDRNNRKVVVADCRAKPDTATIPITLTESGCTLRDDFAGGVTYVQSRAVYLRPDGVEAVAQGCTDTGETLAHTRVTNVCNVLTDLTGYVAIPQYRVQVTRAGVASYRTDCTPDPASQVALQKDPVQCVGTFVHGTPGTQSYGTARWWHDVFNTGTKNYVTTCDQDTAVTYAHSSRVTAYQHNDTTKTSRPMTEIYITDATVGEVIVSASQVRAGAAEVAYTLDRQETQASGSPTYDGCSKYQEQSVFNVYKRPEVSGTTEFPEFAQAGPTIGPVDACEQQVANSWPVVSQSGIYPNGTTNCVNTGEGIQCQQIWSRNCTWQGRRRFLREDQTVVSQSSGNVSATLNQVSNEPTGPNCGTTTTTSTINSWATSLGWAIEGYFAP